MIHNILKSSPSSLFKNIQFRCREKSVLWYLNMLDLSSDLCFVASSSPFPVRETKPFNNVESCLLQEEICGGGGFTWRPTWIFSKSMNLFFIHHRLHHSSHSNERCVIGFLPFILYVPVLLFSWPGVTFSSYLSALFAHHLLLIIVVSHNIRFTLYVLSKRITSLFLCFYADETFMFVTDIQITDVSSAKNQRGGYRTDMLN